jgi:hypothetical protein
MAEPGTFPETWTPLPGKPYATLEGAADMLVRTTPLPQGYLWQFRKKYGFAKSLDEAKAWVEGLATHYSIPPAQRWMSI